MARVLALGAFRWPVFSFRFDGANRQPTIERLVRKILPLQFQSDAAIKNFILMDRRLGMWAVFSKNPIFLDQIVDDRKVASFDLRLFRFLLLYSRTLAVDSSPVLSLND